MTCYCKQHGGSDISTVTREWNERYSQSQLVSVTVTLRCLLHVSCLLWCGPRQVWCTCCGAKPGQPRTSQEQGLKVAWVGFGRTLEKLTSGDVGTRNGNRGLFSGVFLNSVISCVGVGVFSFLGGVFREFKTTGKLLYPCVEYRRLLFWASSQSIHYSLAL